MCPPYKINADKTVAVSTETYFESDMTTCPRGVTVQLLGAGGVAMYGVYAGEEFFVGWCPLPRSKR
jgi:hypothetical protein